MTSLAEHNASVIARENYLDPPENDDDTPGPACPECGSPNVGEKDYGDNAIDCLDCGIWFVDERIWNPIDVAALYGIWEHDMTTEAAIARVKRAIFKYTTCGAWIAFEADQVVVGSIVEGVEEGTPPVFLPYPFTGDELDKALDQVEAWAEEIWMETHGCEACGDPDEYNNGYIRVNPNCPTCGGEGIII